MHIELLITIVMKNALQLFVLFCLFFTFSCNKTEEISIPTLKLKTDSGFTHNGSFVQNHKAILGIEADGGGSNITNLVIKISKNGQCFTILDEGYNQSKMDVTKIIQLSQGDSLNWTISVMNKDRQSASLSFFTRDTSINYGEIFSFQNLQLGMQNSNIGSFLNPFTGIVYNSTDANLLQNDIHVLSYYYISSGTPSFTFSSPGDSDAPTYLPSLSSWTNLNYTDWDYVTQISTDAFDSCSNDSLLIVSFHSGAGISSRKYKWATAGKVIPFKTTNGKVGLIKVNSVSGNESGYIDFDLKIQK